VSAVTNMTKDAHRWYISNLSTGTKQHSRATLHPRPWQGFSSTFWPPNSAEGEIDPCLCGLTTHDAEKPGWFSGCEATARIYGRSVAAPQPHLMRPLATEAHDRPWSNCV